MRIGILFAAVLVSACATSQRPPVFAGSGELVYPAEAKSQGIEGMVVVRYDVMADGRVANVAIVESRPTGVFDDAALDYVASWRFNPATDQGDPVAAPNRSSEIHFKLSERDPYEGY